MPHEGLPVKGYGPQSEENVALVNAGKELEERVLRWIESLSMIDSDPRMRALAVTHIQTGFMWAARSVFQPKRIALPEDPDFPGGNDG